MNLNKLFLDGDVRLTKYSADISFLNRSILLKNQSSSPFSTWIFFNGISLFLVIFFTPVVGILFLPEVLVSTLLEMKSNNLFINTLSSLEVSSSII